MKTGKRLLAIIVAVVLFAGLTAVSSVSAKAEAYGFFRYSIQDGTIVINKYTGSSEVLEIPGKIDGKTVTGIDNYAFTDCSSLKNVTIPKGVKSIGDYAFSFCESLETITIPSSVTSIGEYAFACCYALKNASIPSGVKSIGDYAFASCEGLENITIPSSVISIGKRTFWGCTGLTSISVAKENSVYDSREKCNAIIETASNTLFCGCVNTTIPSDVAEIGAYVFFECSGLENITIPSSVTSIGESAFEACSSLKNITIPSSVTNIGEKAFGGCIGLTEIIVAEDNPVFDSRDNCNAIIETSSNELIFGCANTVIPSGVQSIADHAFSDGCGLTGITIPSSVTNIGKRAFGGCSSLKKITVAKDNPVYDSRNKCNAIIETSSNTLLRGCAKTVIPSDVESIGDYAFLGCDGLKSITVPMSVKSIGKYAFSDCKILKSITLPPEVQEIGEYAFLGCDNLVIRGYIKTFAKQYAAENGFKFSALDYYKDVLDPAVWYYDPVHDIAKTHNSKGTSLMSGYGDGSSMFGPADPLTRQDFAVILYRLADEPDVENIKKPFPDTDQNGYYYQSILWAKATGVIKGYDSGKFGVGDQITREQVATILYRYAKDYLKLDTTAAKKAGKLSQFKDRKSVSSWAKDALTWANGAGIITGKDNGKKIDPQGNAARAEIGAMVLRFIDYMNTIAK